MTLSYRSIFFLSALLTRGALLVFLFTSSVGLMPDEAQYWTWSQLLDIGYYSKPPGIAWQISLGTHLFGSTEFGVRCISLLLPIFSALVIRKIVLTIVDDEKSSWLSAIAFIISPLGFSTSFLATTDAAMVLATLFSVFWYLQLWDSPSRYLAAGLCIALGALWKWMIFSLWIIFAIDLLFRRKDLKAFFQGVILSLVGLLPVIVWNMSHDFVTFRHVGGTLEGSHSTAPNPNPLSFLFAGIALISPGFFLFALPGFRVKNAKAKILQLIIVLIWGILLVASCTRKMQGNWAVLAQVMFFPLIGVSLAQKAQWHKIAYLSSVLIAILLQTIALATPYFGERMLKICPFKQGIGNSQISKALTSSGYAPDRDFLFSDRYQTTSQLWFYGPQQQKAYFFNIHGLRQNQFSYWPGMKEECLGKTGYFVAIFPVSEGGSMRERVKKFRKELKPYFSHLDKPIIQTLFSISSVPVRSMIVIRCKGFNGQTPQTPYKF